LPTRVRLICLALAGIALVTHQSWAQKSSRGFHPVIPKTWDDAAMATLEVPLADPVGSPKHVSADYYYKMPVRPIYKEYPIYAPDREPPGYLEWLKRQEPVILWGDKGHGPQLVTREDWIKAVEMVFEASAQTRDGCPGCHTPPLYINNKLTPAEGFTPPPDAEKKYDILPASVGTDPNLALKTRRGTGYYKVPSLKGVWYRSMFGHSGWCATLEDWFDARRVRDDYVPTGFIPYGAKTYAVKGHPFGLGLKAENKKALLAFLKSL